MKKILFPLLASLLLLSSCKKEEKNSYISYKIVKNGGTMPSYTVRYTLANGSTQTKGPITDSRWLSDVIREVEPGTELSLALEANPSATFDMMIYINGALEAHREGGGGYGTQTLTARVPD
jgi:hypothetical protein